MDDMSEGSAEQRRAAFANLVHSETGIDDAMIRNVVHTFYGRIRADELLGPIFEARISDWDTHLERMCAFWSSVTLMSGRYHGRPMPAHAPLPVGGKHFDHWLSLFAQTTRDVCPTAAADLFMEKAQMIATSLELGIATHRGVMLAKGARLPIVGSDAA